MLMNAEPNCVTFNLPNNVINAKVFVDENGAYIDGITPAKANGLLIDSNNVTVDALTAVIIRTNN